MTDTLIFSNNPISYLAGSISNTATTCNLASGTGVLFPNPWADEYFVMTFTDSSTGLVNEIVWVTARSGDTLTIVRGQEGTSAVAWTTGDTAATLITAGVLASFQQQVNNVATFGGYYADTGTANAVSINLGADTPASYAAVLGVVFRVAIAATNTADATFSIVGLSSLNIVTPDGNLASINQLRQGGIALLAYDGDSMQLLSITNPAPVPNIIVLTGAGTFTVPAGWYAFEAELVAGGAGGAGTDGTKSGGGGGAGGAVIKTFSVVNAGFTAAYSVGAGGAGGAAGLNDGADGGSSSFNMDYTPSGGGHVIISATGGSKGVSGANPSGGDGGVGTGGSGSLGFGGENFHGGSGGDGFPNANSLGGYGGASYYGGGGRGSTSNVAAQNGQAPGSGGGGAYGVSSLAGGAGKAGTIILRPLM